MPGGPVFFVQKRVGKDGKLFDCYKFRTMIASPQPSPEGKGATEWSTVSVAGGSRRIRGLFDSLIIRAMPVHYYLR